MEDLDFKNVVKIQHKIEFDSNKHFMKDNIIHCKVCGEPLEIERGATKIPLVCSCYEKQEKARKMRENEQKRKDYINYLRSISMVGKRFENANFNDIDKNHNKSYLQACSRCENYCNKSNEMLENGFGIYIYGSCGGGKTYLTACMANKLIEKAHSVLFTNFMEISRMIRNTYDTSNDENESEVIERIKNVDFLFIDDFGTEKVAKGGEENWLQEKIYDIINSRYIDLKPVIFSSNYSIEQLAERGFMEKTIDRVSEMSTAIMKIQEKNFRKKGKELF